MDSRNLDGHGRLFVLHSLRQKSLLGKSGGGRRDEQTLGGGDSIFKVSTKIALQYCHFVLT